MACSRSEPLQIEVALIDRGEKRSSMTHKIMTIVGARPQFVKAAAVTRAMREMPDLIEVMVHTGQHFDQGMSAVFFEELAIPDPAYNLGINGGAHGDMTGRMLIALEPVLMREAPEAVLVYGDTNSTLAGALAAAKLHVPVFHVEAGLRSYNRRMPEEINRVLADQLSALLFCPTAAAVENLAKEGIREGVYNVGDVMFDATLYVRQMGLARSRVLERLGLKDGRYVVLTLHRAESTDDANRLTALLAYVEETAAGYPIVFPVHPRTRAALERIGYRAGRILLVDPVSYVDMHRLLAGAHQVFTDSGGLQKEAYFHRVPCITLREETEWVETITCGWNRLWSVPAYAPQREIGDYGTGDAAQRITSTIREWLRSA
jgi:UDP-GlcNAc3NAcA epimerase